MRVPPFRSLGLSFLLLALSGCQGDSGEGGEEPQARECPGHWHASFDLYVHGEPVSYVHPKFQLEGGQGMPVRTHLHRGSEWQWHFEPLSGPECFPLRDTLAYVDTTLEPGRLVLDGAHADLDQAGTYEGGANGTLVASHRAEGGSWETVGIADLAAAQPGPGERIVVAYGTAAEMDLEAWQAAADARTLAPSYGGQPVAA